jgi:chromate reductase
MNKDSIRVLGFAGSLRAGSTNRALLRAATGLSSEGMTIETFDLSPIPLYNEDVERAGFPEAVAAFHERIRAADALLIAVPEYNYSVSGVLKNAIDWGSRPSGKSPLAAKPCAILGASAGMYGTVRAQSHFRQIAQALDIRVLGKPEVLVPKAREKFDTDGRLIDEVLATRIRSLLDALAQWTARLSPRPPWSAD